MPTVITTSGTTARSAQLSHGIYEIEATKGSVFAVGGSSVDAVKATGHLLGPYVPKYIIITSGKDYVAAIQEDSAGRVTLTRMKKDL